MSDRRRQLSKAVSHALRHDPHSYGIVLDAEGWTSAGALLAGLQGRSSRWREISLSDIANMVRHSSKQRFEIEGDRIRALYGHSVPGRIVRPLARPPDVLFHGTAHSAVSNIRRDGLRPMRRQYVHLSVDRDTAMAVGRRKNHAVVVLRVAANDAYDAGVSFWRGNATVWLAEPVPSQFLGTGHSDDEKALIALRRLPTLLVVTE